MTDFWKHTEGRRLEFKGEIPSHSDLAKTVVAFANDAGGDIYIGIDNKHDGLVCQNSLGSYVHQHALSVKDWMSKVCQS